MLTIFTLPKPFEDIYEVIQRNAIRSWTLLKPKPEILLFEDEKNTTKKVAEEFSIGYITDVKKNEFGTPLINDIFEKAQEVAKNDILVYVNADIILISNFIKSIKQIKDEKNFLIIGQRIDLDIKEEIDFGDISWEMKLKEKVRNQGKIHPATGIDYFIFKRRLWDKIPPFAIGRTVWDQWLLWSAWKSGVKVIDATSVITAIHQNHPYITKNGKNFNPWKTKEAKRNLKLAGGYRHCFTIRDATYILTPKGLRRAPKMSVLRRLELIPYLGFFIRQRERLFKLFKIK